MEYCLLICSPPCTTSMYRDVYIVKMKSAGRRGKSKNNCWQNGYLSVGIAVQAKFIRKIIKNRVFLDYNPKTIDNFVCLGYTDLKMQER